MIIALSTHAVCRMQQRGISYAFLKRLVETADMDQPAGRNCRLLRVTRRSARALRDERLSRFAVIVSEHSGEVVTVAPISSNSSQYRRRA